MRTLIVSDLHLGGRLGHDVLRREAPLRALLEALEGVDRLVLLGDVVELLEGRTRQAMAVTEPVMRALGERIGSGGLVVIVPGNHDSPLVRPWVRRGPAHLTLDTLVPTDATPLLQRLAGALWPAQVEVRYPGVWLTPRVWATHGHYINRHLAPSSAFGVSRTLLGGSPTGPASPANYERSRRPSLQPASRWLPRPAAALLSDAAEVLRAWTIPRVRRRLLKPHLSPLTSRLLGLQMRHASVPALAAVAERLGVEAEYLLFGHVHRLGPLPGEDLSWWQGSPGPPWIVNCGSWLYEPLLVHRARPPHPYWPGGAVELIDDQPPRTLGLLDQLPAAALR